MAYEISRLPPSTALYWETKTRQIRCIGQRGAALFLHYDVPFPAKKGDARLTRQRGATLACEASGLGLSHKQTAAYLGIESPSVKTHATSLRQQLGINTAGGYDPSYYPSRSLVRLAQLRVVELARPAKLSVEPPPIIFEFVNGLLQGKSRQQVGAPHGLSGDNVKERVRYWREKAEFETTDAYAMHLLAAGKVGEITHHPALMKELPALTTSPETLDNQFVFPRITKTGGAW